MIVLVASAKGGEVNYTVDTEAGTCDCPQYTKRLALQNAADGGARTCKHIDWARTWEKENAQ